MNFKIEKKGWVYIILCFIVTGSAVNTSNNSLFLLSSFMLSILILSGIFSSLNLYFLKIEGIKYGEFYAKKWGYLIIKLKKNKIFPQGLKRDGFALHIKNNEIFYPIYFPKRGLYKLPPILVESAFPFGLIKRKKIIKINDKVLVYPSCDNFSLPSFKIRKVDGEEKEEAKKWGEILEFYGIRIYQIGDDPRHIHWKKSAQKRELLVKEYETKSRGNLQLFLDTHIKEEEIFEEEVEKVATWCCNLLNKGKSVSLMTWENFLPEGSGEGQKKKVLSFLSLVKKNG